MLDSKTLALFQTLDRAFWLVWIGFLALIPMLVRQVLNQPAELAALAPDQAACLAELPQVALFSTAGQAAFWTGFAIEMAIYALLLALAHQVIRRCAKGDVFVAPMITSLRRIGWIIALFPVVDLLILNLQAWAYVATGDMKVFAGTYAPDIPVLAVGLLLVTMASAMKMAVALHRDAELTI
ncbi:MAG: hypothetical protein ACRC14_00080 [Paracoccaceae bacterium]